MQIQNQSYNTSPNAGGTGQSLKDFQIDQLSIKEKSDWNYGKQLAQYLVSTINGGTSSYFWIRNQRWRINRGYANGRINMSRWQDLFEFNGKTNYINLLWMPINICNRIICGLVGRWMSRNEKIFVTATDSLSVKDKQDQYDNLEFIVENRKKLEELQNDSGVQMIPENQTIPSDKEELRLWQSQFLRLPEEILYEMGVDDVLQANGLFDTIKEKMLHDGAEVGFMATYTWMDDEGVIHVEWLKPENCFYSYSDYPDLRDTTWRGHMPTMKISELRKKYGQQFNPDNPKALTEEQIWNIAQTSKEYQLYDNITWLTNWNVTFVRPYDEWNVQVIAFEIKTVDSEAYTVTTTKKNKSTIIRKGKPEKPDENDRVIEDTKINIYRGVYELNTQTMLEWGLKKNMIRPQDPKEIGNAEFSYSFYMPQNFDMTTLAIPEKIQEPVDQMIAVCLRMQQLIAKMRPPGAMINWDALQNIDYGLGDANKTIDVQKLYDQTGTLYYRGKDAEGNQIPVPIVEIANNGFAPQMQALIELYRFHYQVLKDELGEDPNLITAASQPRVAVQNIEAAQQESEYSTGYIYDGFTRIIEDTAKKVSCLLKTSVVYGSSAYRDIVGDKDSIANRMFGTKFQMLPDSMQLAKFEAIMNNALNTNQDLVLFINPFELMRIAKEDIKLAEALFRLGQKKMLIHQQTVTQQNQQATIQGQIQSAQASEQAKQQTEEIKGNYMVAKEKEAGLAMNKNATIQMVASILSKGGSVPAQYQPFVDAVIKNIMLPLAIEDEQTRNQVAQQMQAASSQMQQQSGQPQPPEQPEVNEQPQEQNIEQQQPEMAA